MKRDARWKAERQRRIEAIKRSAVGPDGPMRILHVERFWAQRPNVMPPLPPRKR